MPGKALVVDANILLRAVLGKRTREVIETYCEQVSFFIPEAAYAEAEEHLAALVIKRGGDPETALGLLLAMSRLLELIGSVNGWASGIPKIGRSWPLLWHWAVQSGRRIPISSDLGSPHGLPAAS